MLHYPQSIVQTNHVEPVPRRVRGVIADTVVFDTMRALYVWEWPHYPQYYIPREDIEARFLAPNGDPHRTAQGHMQPFELRVDASVRNGARLVVESPIDGLRDTMRFRWDTFDQWFEEDEEVFVHPRDPYTRVDALRSSRNVRIELDGVVLAESSSPVLVFETGLPTRYYIDQRSVHFSFLRASGTRTECPYKGRTTKYWSIEVNGKLTADVAWMYSFPTRQLLPIAGLVAFLNEKVDIAVDGQKLPRPETHMS